MDNIANMLTQQLTLPGCGVNPPIKALNPNTAALQNLWNNQEYRIFLYIMWNDHRQTLVNLVLLELGNVMAHKTSKFIHKKKKKNPIN